MNKHKEKLGLKIPENYFMESKDNIINKNLNSTDKDYSFRFYQLSFAAIFIFTLIYFNYPFLESESINFETESPIISTILLDEEITEEHIIDFLTDQVVSDVIYMPK
tara:strand:+ start:307 stop:627 length:321 start_codon:yes stop_codon:yes gene_type:complete